MIADDEPRLRQVLVRLMTSDGFTCLEASDGVEALEKLDTVPAALLLSDLRMPRMDGIELLRQARAKYPDLAVILITAVADVELALSCLANGAM
ncbi:MAG TPA: response regulator, partial [Gemmatimonadaceae bacterium]